MSQCLGCNGHKAARSREQFCKRTSLIEKAINAVNVLLVYYDQMHHSEVYGRSLHLPHEGLRVC